MAEVTGLNIIFNWFKSHATPTRDQFYNTFFSFRHKNDRIALTDLDDGLKNELNSKLSSDAGIQLVASAEFKGIATSATVPPDTTGKSIKYSVFAAQTLTHLIDSNGDAIVVSSGDVTNSQCQVIVSDGVAVKVVTPLVELVNNLSTNNTGKALTAAQGVALKALIDGNTASFTNYPTKVSLYPDYLFDKSAAYSPDELTTIAAIPLLDLQVPPSEKDDIWEIQLFTRTTVDIDHTLYDNVLQIRNTTKSEYYKLVKELTPDSIIGISYYSDDVTNNGKTISKTVGIDWGKVPSTFEAFPSNLRLVPRVTTASAIQKKINEAKSAAATNATALATTNEKLRKLDLPDYVKNKNITFSDTELSVLNALKKLNLTVPSWQKGDTWQFQLIATNPPTLGSNFNHVIQIHNSTNNEYYVVARGVNPNPINNTSLYSGLVSGNIAPAVNVIDAEVAVDWASLPSSFENFPLIDINVNQSIRYPSSYCKGKVIHKTGTSIPQASLYPEIACLQNGALCINKAIGSSMMRKGKKDGTINGLPYTLVWRKLTDTIAEKQAIIDNWSTIRPTLDADNQGPSSLSDADKALILSCSYENVLLPYLNGTYPKPDIFDIDHGYNDNSWFESHGLETYNEFTTLPSDRVDKYTFIGAFNWIVDLILSYIPDATIIISGHYENTRYPRVAAAQQFLANYCGFYIIKTWEETGWSERKIPGSKDAGIWDTAPYNDFHNGFSENYDITVTNYNCPDGTHPASNPTGRSQRKLGQIHGRGYSKISI